VKEKIAELEVEIKRLSNDIEQAKKDRGIDMAKLLLANKTALQEKENLLLKQLQEARISAATSGWVRDLTAEGVEPNPGPCPVAGCGCNLSLSYLIKPKGDGGMGLSGADKCPCSGDSGNHPVWKHNDASSATPRLQFSILRRNNYCSKLDLVFSPLKPPIG